MIIINAYYIYLLVINAITFVLYGADKKRAKNDEWRIPEKAFFIMAIIGGGLGGLLGMKRFHHKTKHWYFYIFNTIGLFVHAGIIYYISIC